MLVSVNYADREIKEYIPGEMIIKYMDDPKINNKLSSVKSMDSLDEEYNIVSKEKLFKIRNKKQKNNPNKIYKLKFQEEEDIEKLAEEYSKLSNVEYAEPNYLYELFYQPDDTKFSSEQWGLHTIRANESWNITKGSSSVVIAIIDTGVDWDHPDLASNIWNNTDEDCDGGNDLDSNGYDDDCRGYDFVNVTAPCAGGEDCTNEDNNPMDFHGHGTHVSGIAAAVTNNSAGISGVCWNCKIMPVRAGFRGSDNKGWLANSDISQAIYYAADNNASIISMSFGGPDSSTIEGAIDYASGKNITLIAAAGNSATSSQTNAYPAAYDNVIAVAGTASGDWIYSNSNYGTWVDVAAPGASVYSTYYNDGYTTASGTSMACPHVAGAAGLLLSYNSSLNQTQIKDILSQTGKDVSFNGIDIPRIDVFAALAWFDSVAPTWSGNSTSNTSPRKNHIVQFNITWNDTIGLSAYVFSWNDTGEWVNITTGSLSGTLQSVSINQTVTANHGTNIYWKFYANDTKGNWNMTDEWNFTVAVATTTYPTLLSVEDYDFDGNIEINWSDDSNETGESYRIYRSTSNITSIDNSVTNLTSVNSGIEFFEDNTTVDGTTYWYAVVTVDNVGNYNDSLFFPSLNGTSNDTINPKTVTNLNVTGSGATATLRWYNVSLDVGENSDFNNLQYVIYYGTNFNSSKSLANESILGYSAKTLSVNSTTISVGSSGTYHFVVTTLDDGGNKNLALDYDNNYGNASLSYTAPSSGSSGGSGGGGGGGGGGGTASRSPNEASRFFVILTEAYTPLMAINSPNIAVNRIGFKVNKKLDKVRINVKVLNDSEKYPRISGEVYQYLSLGAENMNQSALSQDVVIKFKVKNTWLKENNIEKEDISLFRFKNGWNKLNTSQYLETNASTYYVAYTPGFSFFAISDTEKGFETTEIVEEVKEVEDIVENNESARGDAAIVEIEGGQVEEIEGGFFAITGKAVIDIYKENGIFLFLLVLIGIGVGAWFYFYKK